MYRDDRSALSDARRQGYGIGRSAAPDAPVFARAGSQHLGCDGRTVQRRLAERNMSFSRVVDALRAELVVRPIEDKSRSLPAVAELLGFSAQSALARWFRERFGCSITQWRTDPRHRLSVETTG
jgi:AraC-like DNA-binding protein